LIPAIDQPLLKKYSYKVLLYNKKSKIFVEVDNYTKMFHPKLLRELIDKIKEVE